MRDVEEMIRWVVQGVAEALPANVAGAYLRGSLVLGDFLLDSSDVDLLVVTQRRVNDAEFGRLQALHDRARELSNPFGKRHEIAYIEAAEVRRFERGRRFPTLGQGGRLEWSEHHANWIIERWVAREHGRRLLGPAPSELIDAVSPEELLQAVRSRMGDWADWARDEADPEWNASRGHKAYVVETMCRALATHRGLGILTKPQAVAWALGALPEPWRETVVRSRAWHNDPSPGPELNDELRAFVLWATESIAGQRWSGMDATT